MSQPQRNYQPSRLGFASSPYSTPAQAQASNGGQAQHQQQPQSQHPGNEYTADLFRLLKPPIVSPGFVALRLSHDLTNVNFTYIC
jgi:hypothetical protein